MDKKNIGLTLGLLILVLVPIGWYAVTAARPAVNREEAEHLAQCLTDSGAKMFGAYWCSHCQSQKQLFGAAFSRINYIECSLPDGQTQTQVCREAGIKGYPTWEFGDGSRAEGQLTLAALAEKTECNYTEGGEQ